MADKRVVVYMHDQHHRNIKILAAQRGISMSELVKQLVDAELKRLR